MSDENITAGEYLRTQFARMDNRFDSIERKLDDLTMRLGSVERELAGMRGDIVGACRIASSLSEEEENL